VFAIQQTIDLFHELSYGYLKLDYLKKKNLITLRIECAK